MQPIVYISGVHSGPNPSPGLGTALSLRKAFPDMRLIAVDYSATSSGLHHGVFDDAILRPSWEHCDPCATVDWATQLLADGRSCWISGLDLEAKYLSLSPLQGHSILVPPSRAFEHIAKPAISVCAQRGYHIAPHISANADPYAIWKFCSDNGWNVWIKGAQYEARQVASWREVVAQSDALDATWGRGGTFIQSHVSGHEESICFVAHRGTLLSAVAMSKRFTTSEGKTWSGKVSPLNAEQVKIATDLAIEMNWTGGGEIECVRSLTGELYVLDFNPRFPAWIHGSTCVGMNLPASLISRHFNIPGPSSLLSGPAVFTRAVIEMPCLPSVTLGPPPMKRSSASAPSKHPSGMPSLSRRSAKETKSDTSRHSIALSIDELEALAAFNGNITPYVHDDVALFERRCGALVKTAHMLSQASGLRITFAHSVKTFPSIAYARVAQRSGLWAECISLGEMNLARDAGYGGQDTILNGPMPKTWSETSSIRLTFHDSVQSLEKWIEDAPADALIGIRLRPPGIMSRFGIDVADFHRYASLIQALRQAPQSALAIHFHFQPSVIGLDRWNHALHAVIECAAGLAEASGKPVTVLDVGGGWTPEQLDTFLDSKLLLVIERALSVLPSLKQLILEPGKAVSQNCSSLFTRVLEMRRAADGQANECIVDASINLLPMASFQAHRLAWLGPDGWRALAPGTDRVLGSICMESDILAQKIAFPLELKCGDVLGFPNAGAYDRSMAYDFGTGKS